MSAELKAGVFVLMALASLVYMTTRLTENRYSKMGTKRYHAHVKDATGLLSKTKVKMAGLDVGALENITLVENHAKVTMQIAADIVMHSDARVAIKSIGFLGDKYIELFPGTDSKPKLEEGGTLAEGSVGGGIDELTSKTTAVVDNLREITQLLKEALKGSGEEEDSRLDRILDNMENFTAGLSSIEKYGELADRLNEVAVNVREITDKIKKGEGTVGKLLYDAETIDKLNSTLSGVNKFITKADKTALTLDAHAGALANTGGSKSYFSVAFQPTYDKYYLVGVNTAPAAKTTVQKTYTTNSATGVTTSETEEKHPRAVFINAQFAKRFGDVVARLGLFESSGGLGLDYLFLNERLKLYTEAYNLGKSSGSDRGAQVNLGTEVHFFKPIYLWGGGDDLISKSGRNLFVGAGLRFTDNDLKALVSAAAGAAR
ncbi:MAG: MCE family protein [Deltaproteobacteria bacterium]|nr:MCE family protein [Deltaproteobacteria bacterium]